MENSDHCKKKKKYDAIITVILLKFVMLKIHKGPKRTYGVQLMSRAREFIAR